MKRNDVIELLKGKTIQDIEHGDYFGWFTIESITCTDGTIIGLSGNADYARIDSVQAADGNWIGIDDE